MPRNVLAADDSKVMRDMVRLALTGAGFSVREASDGIEALQRINGEPMDLIIRQAVAEMGRELRTGTGRVEAVLSEDQGADLDLDRIGMIGAALGGHTAELAHSLAPSAECSEASGQAVPRIMCNLQFQDRAKQRIENTVTVLSVLGTALGKPAGAAPRKVIDRGWVESLLRRITLAEMEEALRLALLREASSQGRGGDVELF